LNHLLVNRNAQRGSFASRDPALSAIIVDGDEIEAAGGARRTRRSGPIARQKTPLLVKIGKVVIRQYGEISPVRFPL
jgi:hypothetical protein